MKLYSLNHSPYSSRVRILIRKKTLPVSIMPPPIALGSNEFKQRYLLAQLPILEISNEQYLPDSWVIMEYLDTCFDKHSLQPIHNYERAKTNLLARYADTYLGPRAILPLFSLIMSSSSLKTSDNVIKTLLDELQKLNKLLQNTPLCSRAGMSLGDIALITTVAYVLLLAPIFGLHKPFKKCRNIQHWWYWMNSEQSVKETIKEMNEGFDAFMTKAHKNEA